MSEAPQPARNKTIPTTAIAAVRTCCVSFMTSVVWLLFSPAVPKQHGKVRYVYVPSKGSIEIQTRLDATSPQWSEQAQKVRGIVSHAPLPLISPNFHRECVPWYSEAAMSTIRARRAVVCSRAVWRIEPLPSGDGVEFPLTFPSQSTSRVSGATAEFTQLRCRSSRQHPVSRRCHHPQTWGNIDVPGAPAALAARLQRKPPAPLPLNASE